MKNKHVIAQARRKGLTQRQVVNLNWVRSRIESDLLELLRSGRKVPANAEGMALVMSCLDRTLSKIIGPVPALGPTIKLILRRPTRGEPHDDRQ